MKNMFKFFGFGRKKQKEAAPLTEIRQEPAKRPVEREKKQKDVSEARQMADQIRMQAQQEALEIRRQADAEARKERERIAQLEERMEQREEKLIQIREKLDESKKRLEERIQKLLKEEQDIAQLKEEEERRLLEAAALSREEAEKRVMLASEERMKKELVRQARRMEKIGREEMEKKANETLATVIQRYAASHVTENTSSVVHLPSEDMKGRIIGKEGRNIKVLENVTGCEIVVDETPGAIVVTGFSPIRRQIAKVSIEKLIEDGRIQPSRIEEVVAKAKKEVAKSVVEAGEEVVYDLGITDFHPSLVQLIGRLKFRTSYGQSVLQHSWEAARIAVMLAHELKANVDIAKKATILHDIGKAVDNEMEGNHIDIGEKIMRKFNVAEPIIKASLAHHEDYPFDTVEAIIVQVSDAISASRPGARRESVEQYVKRMEGLENIAMSFGGVKKAYAIAAGKELRVFVEPKKIDDMTAIKLAQDIAQRVEQELEYPGEVKVNVIRELRTEALAK